MGLCYTSGTTGRPKGAGGEDGGKKWLNMMSFDLKCFEAWLVFKHDFLKA